MSDDDSFRDSPFPRAAEPPARQEHRSTPWLSDPWSDERLPSIPQGRCLGITLGSYQLLTELGVGSMGTVYIARRQGLAAFERLYAVKVPHHQLSQDPHALQMFLDEARLGARLTHPNLVQVHELGASEAYGIFFVMDYIDGIDLGSIFSTLYRQKSRLPVPVAGQIVLDTLTGLVSVHDMVEATGAPAELIHRDVAPDNIIVGRDGISRLTDFGVAKARLRLVSTRSHQLKGKLGYRSPEQAFGGHPDPRSDVFSAGVVLYEALSGRPLFPNGIDRAALASLEKKPPTLRGVAPDLVSFDDVIKGAVAVEPGDRFASAREFSVALHDALAPYGGAARSLMLSDWISEFGRNELEAQRFALNAARRELDGEPADPTLRPPELNRLSAPSPIPARSFETVSRSWLFLYAAAAVFTLVLFLVVAFYLAPEAASAPSGSPPSMAQPSHQDPGEADATRGNETVPEAPRPRQ